MFSPIVYGVAQQGGVDIFGVWIALTPVPSVAPRAPSSFGDFVCAYPVVLLFGLSLVIWGITAAVKKSRETKRTEAVRKVAADLQLTFETDGEAAIQTELGHFPTIPHYWDFYRVRNVMKGVREGAEVLLFDFDGRVQGTRNTRRCFTMARFALPQLVLPSFTLRPEELIHKIFGYGDIDFPEAPVFSEMFLLASPNEAGVRELFDRELTAMLETKRGISLEADGEQLLFYRENSRPDPAALRAFLDEALSVFSAFVAARQRTRAST